LEKLPSFAWYSSGNALEMISAGSDSLVAIKSSRYRQCANFYSG
jgi:hypothetical protein